MTDGRIPGKWISEPRFAEMDVDTWCVLTKAIAWSNEAGTDGHIKRRYLSQFHPSGDPQPNAYEHLHALGIWSPVADGYQFNNWAKKPHQGGLGQSTAEQVQKNRDASKATSKAYRDRQKSDASRDTVTTTGHVGQDRTGQASTEAPTFSNENVNVETGEVLDAPSITEWPVVKIPTGNACRICNQEVSGNLDAWGLCSKVSAPHVEARKQQVAA